MSFDNIKLDKGLYSSSKGFTASLEAIDPSENYVGTALEGLDAYQRQLKRFDIKVSGRNSDSISKFFQTTDSAALFPEYVSRAVLQGIEEEDKLSKIIATTTNIDSLDYRSISSLPSGDDIELANVAEGAHIPQTVIKSSDKLTRLHKRGRMLVASYEAIKFQKLDLFTITLKQIGAYIARSQFNDAVEVIAGNIDNASKLSGSTLQYTDLISLWQALEPYKLTTILAGGPEIAAMLNISEFKDSNAGLNFHGTGNMITPFGAEIVNCSQLSGGGIIGLDRSCAVEKVQAGEVLTEYDKLIDRQLERATISTICGFSKLYDDAIKVFVYPEGDGE